MKKYLILFLLCLLIPARLMAQEIDSLKAFPANNPLSYHYVKAIAQDKHGFMWFGMQEGLYRYDGYQFISFHHDASDKNSLAGDIISGLLMDKDEQLWVATRSGGVSLYREASQDFINFTAKSPELRLTDNNVNVLMEDSAGNIWVGTEYGLNIIFRRQSQWTIKQIVNDSGTDKSLPHNSVETILQVSGQEVWVGTNGGGISVFDLQGNFIKTMPVVKDGSEYPASKRIKALIKDDTGIIWIGTVDGGLIKYDRKRASFDYYLFDESDYHSLSSNNIEAMYQDSRGNIWIATDKGMLIYDPALNHFKRYNHSPTNSYSLANDFVLTFFEDKNQMMWIGTFYGVNRWDPNMTTFNQYDAQKYPALKYDLITGFAQLKPGEVFISNYGGGIYQLSLEEDKITPFAFNKAFKGLRIMTLYAEENTLWVGTRAAGLFRVELATGEIKNYKYEHLNESSLSANSVTDIFRDSRGELWISTYHKGINRLNKDGTFTRFEMQSPVSDKGPNSNNVLQIIEDSQGHLWFATYGGGINRFDPKSERFLHLNHDQQDSTSLNSEIALTMFQDSQGNIWVGTTRGLDLLTHNNLLREHYVFEHFNVKNGMKSQSAYGIAEDTFGNIWFSSNKGLSRYSLELNSFKHFDTSHGLRGLEYVNGSVFTAYDNTLYFGSAKGFTSVNPYEVSQDQPAPEVRLTNILKLNETMKFDSPLSELNSLVFDHNDHLISFEYVGLNYSDPDSTRYKYRLLGFDQEWVDVGKLRRATYTNLPAGSYQLQVIAGNNDEVWSDPLTLSITVKSAPWFTWWAYLLYIIVIAAGILAYSRFLHRKLLLEQQQRIFLKQQVKDKTQEFQLKNIELEQANKQLENAATIDKLTGVKSRRYLDIYIEQASQLMSQIHQNILPVQRSILPRLYIFMVKLRDASQVNNSQLLNLTDLLLYSRNQDDLVIRWSEDTFAVIGYEKEENARELAIRLSNRLEHTLGGLTRVDMAYSFYPFNFEQPMELSWDQVSVLTEHGLKMVGKNEHIQWLGLYAPKIQPFNYLEMLQVDALDDISKLIRTQQG
ncbi:diguanylate cyclase [Thalassomonas viridans]|uniref:Diguanylate cyclase n=1 Tax=Thalassomonas viridans TaxID=137584 RepID=A0AAF0C7W7_9GAMM|nr:two-component regulator propeller domain-containing protein [Thalassomonas viridans]WDE03781.1 diguanylate cyclase [Thalassomonas viridans]